MIRGNRAIAIAVAVSLALLVGASEASAKGSFSVGFSAKGSKGYDVSVSANSLLKGKVSVTASGKGASATYTTKGKFSKDSITAKLKGFGKVKMKFDGKGKPKKSKPPKGCTGPDSFFQEGNWEGTFTFKGENGYTKVSTKKAEGYASETKGDEPFDCSGGGGGGQPKPCTSLSLNAGSLNFSAFQVGGGTPEFNVFKESSKNGVEIARYASTKGGTFTANVNADTATVNPPSPFSGTGDYATGNLGGSLKVKLPGETVSVSGGASLFDSTCAF